MQTFLPLPSFLESARCLDNKRLGKQRLEAAQILRTVRGESRGWIHHPAVKMWQGHELALAAYGLICCQVWRDERHFVDNLAEEFFSTKERLRPLSGETPARSIITNLPPWFGDERLHSSHRSNLLRKDPVHYGKFGWSEPPDLAYYWPV